MHDRRQMYATLPLVANLRCGLWYSPRFDATCYFKSTDGHNGWWNFSTTRLNMALAELAAARGGCIIVDATRKGKRFPVSACCMHGRAILACGLQGGYKNTLAHFLTMAAAYAGGQGHLQLSACLVDFPVHPHALCGARVA